MKYSDEVDKAARIFDNALADGPEMEYYQLRLFVSGSTPRSIRAIQNIKVLCENQLSGRYDLEVVDLYQHPEQAKPEQIVVTPTLVKKLPLPLRKIVGDLSEQERVLVGLDIVVRKLPA